jgi:hypothetical protein
MQVIEETFEDMSDEVAHGYYDYYYSGAIFRLIFPDREFRARRYNERPGEAHFLSFAATTDGSRRLFQEIPYDDTAFREAALFLRDTAGADTVSVLLPGGYTVVDFARFPGVLPGGLDRGADFHCFRCRNLIPERCDHCPRCGWTWQ